MGVCAVLLQKTEKEDMLKQNMTTKQVLKKEYYRRTSVKGDNRCFSDHGCCDT